MQYLHDGGFLFTLKVMMTRQIDTLPELEVFTREILKTLTAHADRATVVLLDGDLGSGKTTFMQQLARMLGVTTLVTSPTYTIMQRYPFESGSFTALVHMDAYRLDALSELEPLRFSELLKSPQTLLCIEWGSKVAAACPTIDCHLKLAVTASGTRTVTVLKS